MKFDFFRTMNKISKKDSEMRNYLDNYLIRERESSKLFNGSFQYCRIVNADDEKLEELLINFAGENNWLNDNDMIDIKKVPEITKKYLEEKEQFLDMAPKIIKKTNEIYEQIDEMSLSFFGQVSDDDKKTIKNVLALKSQVADAGIDCLLYLSMIRFCFNPDPSTVGYRLVREQTKLDKDMEVLLSITLGLDIAQYLMELLAEVGND